jgi:hypothetical protein
VHSARCALADIDMRLQGSISSRQVARSLLKVQSDLVEQMAMKGLLSHSHAAALLAAVNSDSLRIEQRRGREEGGADGGGLLAGTVSNPVHRQEAQSRDGGDSCASAGAVDGKKKRLFHRGGGEKYIALGAHKDELE